MTDEEQAIRRHVRRMVEREGGDIANVMVPHLLAFREMIQAAEEAGWDSGDELSPILNRARQAHAALTGWTS